MANKLSVYNELFYLVVHTNMKGCKYLRAKL